MGIQPARGSRSLQGRAASRTIRNEAARTEAAEKERKAAAEALLQLHRIVVAASARKPSQKLRLEKQDLFEAWYLRRCEQEKARQESERQEVAFGLAVLAAVLVLLAYLCGMFFTFHRFASAWELIPILFGSLIMFSVLFYKTLGRRGKKG